MCRCFYSALKFGLTCLQTALGERGFLRLALQAALLLARLGQAALGVDDLFVQLCVAFLAVGQLHVEFFEAGFGIDATLLQIVELGIDLGQVAAELLAARAGLLGLPQPGMRAKLVPAGEPAGERYELRVKGPNITPGYYRDARATAEVFDEEGYFKTGDAARWVDEAVPEKGIAFAGRVSEEFKLASGTWVRATTLRGQLITALQPYVHDLVIAAPDRPWLGALVWLDPAACTGDWKSALKKRLAAFNAGPGGSSTRVHRLLPLGTPPSFADGEVTDKRSINTRRVLERRAAEVARLYAEPVDIAVISA